MSWLYVHLPQANVDVFFPILVLIGFSVGIISSFLGIGGAWMVTPVLNILGLPMAYAIGTDITHVGAKSVLATSQHSKMGHIDYKLGLYMLIGTVIGLEGGAQVVMSLERGFIIDSTIQWIYMVLLLSISLVIFYDQYKIRKGSFQLGIQWHKKLQKLAIPPIVHFKKSNLKCSIWLPIFVGVFTGFLAGLLGIGGGLLRLPALIYLVGCPTVIAVGTDLFEVMISGLYGSCSYMLKGRVDFLAASLMFIGAVFGTKIGAIATQYIQDGQVQLRFGIAVLGSLFSVICQYVGYTRLSKLLIFSMVFILAGSILKVYIQAKKKTTAQAKK